MRPTVPLPSSPKPASGVPLALAALLLWFAPTAFALEVSARLDPASVEPGAPVFLVLEIQGESGVTPDLSVLGQDFEIVDRHSRHSVSIVNGQRTDRRQLTLTLIPTGVGELEIPPIPIGDAATLPLRLSVGSLPAATGQADAPLPPSPLTQSPIEAPVPARIPAQPEDAPTQPSENETGDQPVPVLVGASVEPARARVGEQILLTVRVHMDRSILRSQLRDPQIANANVLPLGEDRYEAAGDQVGSSVYERRYALFPVAAGPLEIEPLVFEGWARGDVAGSAGFPLRERPFRAASDRLAVEVKPPAASPDNQAWLPARSLTLTESGPETYRIRAGQPLERRISLRAEGLMSRSLPALSVDVPYQLTRAQQPPRLWDERHPQGVIGTRQEVISLTAREPGHYRLPAVRVPWWSTDTEHWETAVLPPRELVVTPGAFVEPGAPAPSPVTAADQWAAPATTGSHPPSRSQPESESAGMKDPPPREVEAGESSLWTWLATLFALAWLVTMVGWWRNKRAGSGTPAAVFPDIVAEPERGDPLTEAMSRVRSAYEAADAAGARDALLGWGAQVLAENPPSNLARLAQRCPEPLRGQILMLEQAFFSPQPLPWERQRVWEHMRHFEPAAAEEPASFRRAKPLRRRTTQTDVS